MNEVIIKSKEVRVTKYQEIFNLCLYSSIAYADIMLLTEKLVVTPEERGYERDLFARTLAVTLSEFTEDMTHLLGKKFRDELIRNNLESFQEAFSVLHKCFNDFSKKNGQALRSIRNNALAHRTHDASIQFQYTFTDTALLLDLGMECIELNTRLTPLTTRLIKSINSLL